MSSLTGSMSNLNEKLLTSSNLNDLLTGAESGSSSNSVTNEKIYSIDRMIKSLNSKINGKLGANSLHSCPSALTDFYTNGGGGYSQPTFSSARSSSSSNGSASNSTSGSLTPGATENQSMLSSLLEGCHSSSQMNGLQPNKLNATTSKLFLLNAHNLLTSGKTNGTELAGTAANAFTNSTNSNLNLLHSLPYSLMNRESITNPLSSLNSSFKPLNYESLSNLNNLNNLSLSQFSQLNGLQTNGNGVSLFGHHPDLLPNYGSILSHF